VKLAESFGNAHVSLTGETHLPKGNPMALNFQHALVIGGSRGVGKTLALYLDSLGIRTSVVARGAESLAQLNRESATIQTIQQDASIDGFAEQVLAELSPDLIFLVGGNQPTMRPINELSWQAFSAAWNSDTKIAFEFVRAILNNKAINPTTLVSFSSGASLNGSPLSGGYAGAKRMQHFICHYANREAQRLAVPATFYSVIPKQLIAGTDIAQAASSAYAKARGISAAQFMGQWPAALTADKICQNLETILNKAMISPSNSFVLTGQGVEAMD
jgi:3-oxoacyl-[acyl-carrier protein] reductase